ncbi:hypothetical protein HNW13_018230 [Shewanella sp. BF02_Schw]|uniref:hypothetical protein n=1 Tax=Shewanella sp. BF02_Schw TaxID=394908 RepID=UPI001783A4C8|nr:hypothetical protein [Shewanella sp. BF02_Schw]MBO1897679.1 hypothetical protein [Shewanella sp. BF02_Schw]
MSTTIEQDVNKITIENVDNANYLESLKAQMIKAIPESAKLFEPRYTKEFDWQKEKPHPDDQEAIDELEFNRELVEKKAAKSEINTLVIAEIMNVLLNKTGPQFKTAKLKSNYDQEQNLLDMAYEAKQLQAMNDFAKGNIKNHLMENGIDSQSAVMDAFNERGPGSLHELTKQFEISSAGMMDLMQDSSALCASNPSIPDGALDSIGETVDSMAENMKEMQETVMKNVMEMVDDIVAQFSKS